jgi:hypothetical protein
MFILRLWHIYKTKKQHTDVTLLASCEFSSELR